MQISALPGLLLNPLLFMSSFPLEPIISVPTFVTELLWRMFNAPSEIISVPPFSMKICDLFKEILAPSVISRETLIKCTRKAKSMV